MKKYSLLIIILLVTFIKTGLCASEGEFIHLGKEYTFHPDGSVEYNYDKVVKINTHVALNNLYGETFVIYNPDYQTVKINKAYTIQADGKRIDLPQNALNEVLPFQAANAPAYNHLKELVVTHTGLEIGATIYLNYSVLTKPDYYPAIDIDEVLQETSPVKEYSLIINVPKDKSLNYTLTGSSVKPVIKEQNEYKQHCWTLKNVSASLREPYQSVDKQYIPRLTATGFDSQAAALEIFRQQLNTAQLNESEKNFVRELVKNKETEKEKILAIQQYVTDMISVIGLNLENTAFKIRTPSEVFQSSYGTVAEKTFLLAAMLKAIDMQPEVIVVYPGTLKKSIKGLKPVKEMKIKVGSGKEPLFLSALYRPTKSIELRGSKDDIWMVSTSKAVPLLVVENSGEIFYNAHIKIKPSLVEIAGSLAMGGGVVPFLDENGLKSYLKDACGLNDPKLSITMASSDRMNAKSEFSIEKELIPSDGYLTYILPECGKGIGSWNMDGLASQRKSVLELPFSIKEVYDYQIETGNDLVLKNKAYEIRENKSAGSVYISVKQEDGVIKIHKELILNKTSILPKDYAGFRQLITTWLNPKNQTLIFSTKQDFQGI